VAEAVSGRLLVLALVLALFAVDCFCALTLLEPVPLVQKPVPAALPFRTVQQKTTALLEQMLQNLHDGRLVLS